MAFALTFHTHEIHIQQISPARDSGVARYSNVGIRTSIQICITDKHSEEHSSCQQFHSHFCARELVTCATLRLTLSLIVFQK